MLLSLEPTNLPKAQLGMNTFGKLFFFSTLVKS